MATLEQDCCAPLCWYRCARRRWGYFPLLSKLRAVSAKPRKPAAPQQLRVSSAAAAAAAAADAEAAGPEADWEDTVPDSPKSNWAELMRQKKRAKEDGIAHMIRIKHAVLIIQVSRGSGSSRQLGYPRIVAKQSLAEQLQRVDCSSGSSWSATSACTRWNLCGAQVLPLQGAGCS